MLNPIVKSGLVAITVAEGGPVDVVSHYIRGDWAVTRPRGTDVLWTERVVTHIPSGMKIAHGGLDEAKAQDLVDALCRLPLTSPSRGPSRPTKPSPRDGP